MFLVKHRQGDLGLLKDQLWRKWGCPIEKSWRYSSL